MDDLVMASRPAKQSISQFRRTMNLLRNGDENAAWDLIEQYEHHLRRVVRRKLDERMRSKFDSVDFVQMVWTSFFRHPSRVVGFDEPDQLIRYLVQVAKHKVIQEYRRRLQSQKYDVTKEQSLNDSRAGGVISPMSVDTPSEIAIARERWANLMNNQSERNRQIVRMRISGATYQEIADKLDINERTARRVVEDLLQSEEKRS
ncbi:MAG TPA: sigma-70 family RNA polymerase sigma factor [Planctomycetaceae bacterium]|nr:RNA polymerase subunit sigma-70 [Blastopirellula sp.]HAY83117.1 sigma-70 family RNA polymerase sigma factor [Planctomycetaceae bacterium]